MQQNESDKLTSAIEAAKQYGRFYCKFVTANDVGLTNAHQEGLHIAKNAWSVFFETEGVKGENKDNFVKIHIDGYYPFESRIIYYGVRTRNEYRITRFWTNSPWDKNQQVGNLIVFIPVDFENFKAYIFDTEEEIENFIETFSLSLVSNNAVYGVENQKTTLVQKRIEDWIKKYGSLYPDSFPETTVLAEHSRDIVMKFAKGIGNPDNTLLKWIDVEYELFKEIERNIYKPYLIEPFCELDPLLKFASSALNRRKSRAGKSLEHHIDFLLCFFNIPFSHPGKTEGTKKPDFLLPSNEHYANLLYDSDKLIMLGAKTTCKDRWRQILNEANRIPQKHLLTLQQGITMNQLDEMQEEKVTLVVPEAYHKMYPEAYQDRLWTVEKFIKYTKEKYSV
ncbi:type II restriction endonuclease [Peribacillus kribbensis]|uniref:type II restriction endonuclease n=1 Tax=Peribacillus kribbensis TaxID=356658 RepID=UPI00042994B5|nr:type II restriction endonuclease [Peribacillus kribbensis]